ncbi:MAG: hypothetical protein MHM6MM_009646, partial [Cercozoa sp. M6MM]
ASAPASTRQLCLGQSRASGSLGLPTCVHVRDSVSLESLQVAHVASHVVRLLQLSLEPLVAAASLCDTRHYLAFLQASAPASTRQLCLGQSRASGSLGLPTCVHVRDSVSLESLQVAHVASHVVRLLQLSLEPLVAAASLCDT